MTPYSLDLRQKIVQAYERGVGSQRQIAELFGVSVSFVEKLFIRLRRSGQVAAKPHAGGISSCIDAAARQQLQAWLTEQPDLTLAELAARLHRDLHLQVGVPRLCKVLKTMDVPRKKSRSTRASATPHK
jgi:transposase